ncbi:hypothetical protein Bbelb_229950 [Branchiostoma belcheri]|nr:hypothetical protein Bbelb_229950 [Branchiostoma belcheri]
MGRPNPGYVSGRVWRCSNSARNKLVRTRRETIEVISRKSVPNDTWCQLKSARVSVEVPIIHANYITATRVDTARCIQFPSGLTQAERRAEPGPGGELKQAERLV